MRLNVRFLSRGYGYTKFLMEREAVLMLRQSMLGSDARPDRAKAGTDACKETREQRSFLCCECYSMRKIQKPT